MLEDLRIQGLGVIEDVTVELQPGLTVVTGETGAGKTMVVGALRLLFGGRADTDRVRSGSDQAVVEGTVRVAADGPLVDRVRDAGGTVDDESAIGTGAGSAGGAALTLRRVVSAAGRSRAHVGGASAPVALLGEVGEQVFALHGQADQWRLMQSSAQLNALDRFARVEVEALRVAYRHWRAAEDRLASRITSARDLEREARSLREGVAEIEAADPQPAEDERLKARIQQLGNADELRALARTAQRAIAGDPDDPTGDEPDAVLLLSTARRVLEQSGEDPQLAALAVRLANLAAEAEDIARDLRGYSESITADPQELDAAQRRLAVVRELIRKYADDLPGVVSWSQNANLRLLELDTSDDAVAALETERDRSRDALVARAVEASEARKSAAAELGEAITAEVRQLAMPDAQVVVTVGPRTGAGSTHQVSVSGVEVGIGPDGIDDVVFQLSAHRGAPPAALHRSASGGELSRVMLAIEVVLASADPVPVMVFDEVDAGVGGRAAIEIGRRLARLAQDRQVIVVTHLAQVAAYADVHLAIDKISDDRLTRSDVRALEGVGRRSELARMLSGNDGAVARKHAGELLSQAKADREADRGSG